MTTNKKRIDKLPPEFRTWLEERVTQVDACWEWRLSLKDGTQPQGKFNGNVINVRRVIVEACTGKPIPRGWIAACLCSHPGCVHPSHLFKQSRSQAFKGAEFSPIHKVNLAKAARRRAILTIDDVRAIRASEKTVRQTAADFGISESHAGGVIRGRFWRDYENPFAGLMRAAS
ncbi:MAG TPA: hypothetical protein VD994_19915 [Prosthecobacter sp.]|nr:hypothetical protein [Prosthecobacter sp.]